jgi:hypothetical protein
MEDSKEYESGALGFRKHLTFSNVHVGERDNFNTLTIFTLQRDSFSIFNEKSHSNGP